jgi:hypothetical protein
LQHSDAKKIENIEETCLKKMKLVIVTSLFFIPFLVIVSFIFVYQAYMDRKNNKILDDNIKRIKQLPYDPNNETI